MRPVGRPGRRSPRGWPPVVTSTASASELAERHVEIPEQVVQVNDEIFVKVIDIECPP